MHFSAGLFVGFAAALGLYLAFFADSELVYIPVSNSETKVEATSIIISKDKQFASAQLSSGFSANSVTSINTSNTVKVSPNETYYITVLEIGKTVGEVIINDCDLAWDAVDSDEANIFDHFVLGAIYLDAQGRSVGLPVLSQAGDAKYDDISGDFYKNFEFTNPVNTQTSGVSYTLIAFEFSVDEGLLNGDRLALVGLECPISGDNGLSDEIVVTFNNNEVVMEVENASADVLPLYQFYNEATGAHFYTASESQKESVTTRFPQFKYEGITYYVYSSASQGRGVYRFYNSSSGAHFYTADVNTRDSVLARFPQFSLENNGQPVFYVNDDLSSGYPVYQFYNADTGAHFYTASESKKLAVEERFPQFEYEKVTYSVPQLSSN